MRTFVMLEPGSTHQGQRAAMSECIALAKATGCDAVKWQFLSSAAQLCERRKASAFRDSYRLIEGTPALWAELAAETRAAGLSVVATAYLPEDVPVIAPLVDRLKLASFESADLLEAALHSRARLIVSTGMMSGMQIDTLLNRLDDAADDDDDNPSDSGHVVLQCTSAYPAPLVAMNLRVIREWCESEAFLRFGLSDHSADVRMGGWAVMAGATILEVHGRLDSTPRTNADYRVSLSPDQLREYVRQVRDAEVALGDGVKRVMPAEQAMLAYRVGHA